MTKNNVGSVRDRSKLRFEEAVEVITRTYMKRGGLTEWDREYVEEDARAVAVELRKKGFLA